MQEKNYAFIDSQNVNLAIRDQGWKLDWKRLRIYLKDKYKVEKVYLFIGFIPWNISIYQYLQEVWYILIFKPVLELSSWKTKWNVDAELVLHSMIQFNNFDKAVIITWDWDFACLVEYFLEKDKLKKLIVPNINKYSWFLKKAAKWRIDSLTFLKNKLEFKKKKVK